MAHFQARRMLDLSVLKSSDFVVLHRHICRLDVEYIVRPIVPIRRE